MQLGIFAKTFAARLAGRDARRRRRQRDRRTIQFNMALRRRPVAAGRDHRPAARDRARRSPRAASPMAAVSGTYNMAHPDAGVRADGAAPARDADRRRARAGHPRRHALHRLARPRGHVARAPRTTPRPDAWRDMLEQIARGARASPSAHDVTLAFEPEHNNVVADAARAGGCSTSCDSPAPAGRPRRRQPVRPGELARPARDPARGVRAARRRRSSWPTPRTSATTARSSPRARRPRLRALRGAPARRRLHRPARPARPPRGRGARVSAVRPRAPSASGQLLRYGDAAFRSCGCCRR